MYEARFTLTGLSGMIFGKAVAEKKARSESHAEFDERTWQQKCRVADDGFLYLPPIALKACLTSTASYAGMRVEGKGVRTYTASFVRGLQCSEPIRLDTTLADVELLHELVISEPGNRRKGTRVNRTFPYVAEWTASASAQVLDAIITPEILRHHLNLAGIMTGLGTWRPENGREYGRFQVSGFETKPMAQGIF